MIIVANELNENIKKILDSMQSKETVDALMHRVNDPGLSPHPVAFQKDSINTSGSGCGCFSFFKSCFTSSEEEPLLKNNNDYSEYGKKF